MIDQGNSLFMGLMSGTSMDGIDAAIVDVNTHQLITAITHPYSEKTQQALQEALIKEVITWSFWGQLNTWIGQDFAEAARTLLEIANLKAQDIKAIGSHGQTICHDATAKTPYTCQLGCAHTIAERTGITVVADFRTRDLVVGGVGAPFAPLYHQYLFADFDKPLAVVNIGGIANISYLTSASCGAGYDTGPGNGLMDAWVREHLNQRYDANGQWAASGEIIAPLLAQLLTDPFFNQPPPKSIGKEYFSKQWLYRQLKSTYRPVDVQATLLALTAENITQAIKRCEPLPNQVILCGGGAHNHTLVAAIQQRLPMCSVQASSAVAINPDYIEAMMFAWLAAKRLQRTACDYSAITGAKKPAILGAIFAPGVV